MAGATLFVCAAIAAAVPNAAKAQAAAPNPSDVAPSERAKRDADKVFHWIMIQGDRTRKPNAAATAGVPAAKEEARSAAVKPARASREAGSDAPARAKGDTEVAAAAPPVTEVRRAPAEAPGAASSQVASVLGLGSAGTAAMPASAAAVSPAPAAAPAVDKPGDTPEPAVAKTDELPGARAISAPAPAPEPAAPIQEAADDAPSSLVVIAQPEPQFPVAAMRSLRRGSVQVKFSVLTDGTVADLEVLHTTSPRINAAALAAIGQWRFQPIAKVQTGAVEVGFNLE